METTVFYVTATATAYDGGGEVEETQQRSKRCYTLDEAIKTQQKMFDNLFRPACAMRSKDDITDVKITSVITVLDTEKCFSEITLDAMEKWI